MKWLCALLLALALPAAAADKPPLLDDAEAAKWTGVGRINIAGYANRGMCTGTLIEPDLVLTAAHCVVSRRTGRTYRLGDVHFVAGWRKGKWQGHATARQIAVHPDYRVGTGPTHDQIAADLALVRLSEPLSVPPFATAPDPGKALRLISYRSDRAHALSGQDCGVTRELGAVLRLACNVIFGASGAPFFRDSADGPAVAAVLSAKHGSTAYAVRVDHALAAVREVLDAGS